ncbi:Thyroid transcription factor 1-associated protein 26-like [Holothuria leucospilota]|uniref:Thyroid transcription factor 1-associated protein 26-like n=1 Tax=Holothuria leucospilota TaxID=206669 RepID=A0A9Q1BG41_HOLLE|nr:Thyroid transcription factor 1-associated protein 26-like [Holothuria leucospilota]
MKELGRQRKNLKYDLKRQRYKRVLGSFAEGQGFADKRKRKAINRYLKLRRKGLKEAFGDGGREENESIQDNDNATGISINQSETELHHVTPSSPSKNGGKSSTEQILATEKTHSQAKMSFDRKRESHGNRYSNAQKAYQERMQKKQQKVQAIEEEKMKREAALENYKKKKLERNKKFNKKTKRGQPIMKHQIDFLLEKIKAQGD